MGVVAVDDSSVNIRVQVKTKHAVQWAVGRTYNRLVKLIFGEGHQGNAPAPNVRIRDRSNVVSTQEWAEHRFRCPSACRLISV